MVPMTDHSVGSSDGKRLSEEKLNECFRTLLMLSSSVKHIWSVENPVIDFYTSVWKS